MRVLVQYEDGSQKVELDDGREVILSSPYNDGSQKIYAENGSTGWLSDKYLDGSQQAKMDNGTEYSVAERPDYWGGKQKIWKKTRDRSADTSSTSTSKSFLEMLLDFIFK